jgi:transposase-like protein
VLDGGKALTAAVRRHAGEAAFIQRCQVHKRRNVIDHLPEEHKPSVKKKLQNAYAMTEYADAKRALERLHRELMELNPSAARSLEEGMEETLQCLETSATDFLLRYSR